MISTFSTKSNESLWTVLTCILGFWLSSSLLLDVLVMPSLYLSGMLIEPLFANSGYLLFSIFNRVELLCSAFVLTSILLLQVQPDRRWTRSLPILGGVLLLGMTLITTYGLTPAMSAMAMDLDLFNAFNAPSALDMQTLHFGYLGLELTKLIVSLVMFRFCWRRVVA
jgi:hypothetical protein